MVKKLIVLCWTSEKKNCLLLIRCKKNCRFNMEIEISLVTEKKQPPQVSNGPPLKSPNCISPLNLNEICKLLEFWSNVQMNEPIVTGTQRDSR